MKRKTVAEILSSFNGMDMASPSIANLSHESAVVYSNDKTLHMSPEPEIFQAAQVLFDGDPHNAPHKQRWARSTVV